MGKSILTIVLAVLVSGLTLAQEAKHHPTRILIGFSQESPVFTELFTEYGVGELPSKNKLKKGQFNSLEKTDSFFSEFGIISLEKIAPISQSLQKAKNINLGNVPSRGRIYVAEIDQAVDYSRTIERLKLNAQIEIVEPDFIVEGAGREVEAEADFTMNSRVIVSPDDPLFSFQWGLENTGQPISEVSGVAGEDINIKTAWDITTGSEDVIVAVLDSGFPKNVDDFSGRVLAGNDLVNGDNDPTDDHGHGTSVASIALATGNNGTQISGVDWKAKLLPVKILDEENSGLYSWWINGVYWALDQNVDVINVSVGGSGRSELLIDAFVEALNQGVHVIACMMNYNDEVPYYPAFIEGVTAVGAINNKGERAEPFSWGGGSNYGNHIDLVAPGNNIASLRSTNPNESASFWSGTSQATPMVAGVVSLMLSVNPDLTPAESRQILRETARGDGTWNKFTGMGVLDASAAVTKAQSMVVSNETFKDNLPQRFSLSQNYPNPFNPTTNISFQLPANTQVSLKVYDLLGREVAVILANKQLKAGNHNYTFDASLLSSGIYMYQMTADSNTLTKKMMLVK